MADKPTYEELEKSVKESERETFEGRRLQEANIQSTDRFRLVFERSNDAIIIHQVGNIKDVNPRACELTGYTREQLLNMSVLDLFSEEDQEAIKNRLRRSVRAGATVFETKWKRANGELFDVEVNSGDFDPKEGIRFGITRDITDRKKVEQALRDSEERYKAIFEQAVDSILIIDPETGYILEFNDRACEALGYTREEFQKIKISDFEVLEDENEVARHAKKIFEEGTDIFETKHRTKSSEIRTIHVTGRAISLREKTVLQVIYRDITVIKQAEESMRESEEFSSSLLENSSIPILVINPDSSIRYVNPAFEELTGYISSEIIGKEAPYLWWCDDPESGNIRELKEALSKGVRGNERVFMKKNGERFWVEASTTPIRKNGELKYELVNWVDVTERKQAEEALLKSEEKYRNLYDEAPVAYMEYDNKGRITRVNRRELEMLGYTTEEMVGERAWNFVTEKEKGQELIKAKLAGDRPPSKNLERTYISKDGTMFPCLIEDVILKNKTGRIIGIRSIIQDITERKRAEDRLRGSEEKIARFKKMESLGLLAGGVAHDLNNVLAGIVSYPELLLLDLPEDSKFRKPIQTIQESGNRAVAIVQDLLTVARGVASAKETLNLNNIIKEYLTSPEFQKLMQFHPTITVKTDLEADLMNMSCSQVHIRKVIMNLVSNASEAIDGNGNVIISTMNRYLDRSIKGYEDVKIGEYVVFSVSDDGSGILSDHLERIFEPFFTKKVMGRSGTGLGLAVVWNIVQDHEGYIDVLSDEKGTTFEIYFPITRGVVTEKDLSISLEDYKGDGETIVVVDDIESQREITCNMLDVLGYKSIAVSSGEEAVEYLREHSVDLILLDMIMDPGINGRETYERIIKIHPNQKAIIVSGFAETDEVKEAQKLGAGQYTRKPLTLEKIGIAIKEELVKS